MSGRVPGYWLHETGPELRPAVWAYLRGEPLDVDQVLVMRDYLAQWVAGDFAGELVGELRSSVLAIADVEGLRAWLGRALEAGIDPL